MSFILIDSIRCTNRAYLNRQNVDSKLTYDVHVIMRHRKRCLQLSQYILNNDNPEKNSIITSEMVSKNYKN